MIQIDGKIIAVFTKYDKPFSVVHVPKLAELKASNLSPDDPVWPMPILTRAINYKVAQITDGLCGVRFFEYKRL